MNTLYSQKKLTKMHMIILCVLSATYNTSMPMSSHLKNTVLSVLKATPQLIIPIACDYFTNDLQASTSLANVAQAVFQAIPKTNTHLAMTYAFLTTIPLKYLSNSKDAVINSQTNPESGETEKSINLLAFTMRYIIPFLISAYTLYGSDGSGTIKTIYGLLTVAQIGINNYGYNTSVLNYVKSKVSKS